MEYSLSLIIPKLNKKKQCISAIALDIDHFKKVNDTYGHDIGDQVLKLVAKKLAKVRGGGRVFRYGGEDSVARAEILVGTRGFEYQTRRDISSELDLATFYVQSHFDYLASGKNCVVGIHEHRKQNLYF